jgi:hypothetical protein
MDKMLFAMLLIVASSAIASAQPSAPGPEHARLDAFAGKWTIDGESEGEKYTLTETCEWFAGRFHIVCQRAGKGPVGSLAGQSIITWDPAAKAYALISINSNGASVLAHAMPAGDVWTWNGTLLIGERFLKVRLTMTRQSPAAYTYSIDGSIDGAWVPLENGRGAKVL